MKKVIGIVLIIITSFAGYQCKKDKLNFFSRQQDVEFGESLDSVILADPVEYPVLDETEYSDAYQFMYNIMNAILSSDDIDDRNLDKFVWKIRIIDKDVLNAFAAPGGYLYFYTGLMKYLDNSAQLAGVMAHEVAHVDQRHTTRRLTDLYSYEVMISIIFGQDRSQLEEIAIGMATGLAALAYSRDDEYEADEYAVRYTADTDYYPKGISGFFEKLNESNSSGRPPEFLSTHPDPGNRLESINEVWQSLGSPNGELFENEYQAFLQGLP